MSRSDRFSRATAPSVYTAALKLFSSNSGSPGAGYTIVNQEPALGPFRSVRLVYANQTASDITLNSSKIASPAASGDNGSTLPWIQVKFNGSASVTLPARTGGAPPDETLNYIVSDRVPLLPASSLNLVQTRSEFPGEAGAIDVGLGDLAAFNAASGLQPVLSQAVLGTLADNAAHSLGTSGTTRPISPHGYIFEYTVPARWGITTGGSHIRGNGTVAGSWGFHTRACLARTAASGGTGIWSPWTTARGGAGLDAATASLSAAITALASGARPNWALLLAYSGNDGAPDPTKLTAAQANITSQLATVDAIGARVFIAEAPPVDSYNSTQNGYRNDQNAWAATLGRTVVPLNTFYEDPLNPGTGLNHAADGIHYNDTAQAVPASWLQPLL